MSANAQHVAIQSMLTVVAQAALAVPDDALDEFIVRADRALAVGPVIDPTLFRDAGEKLVALLDVARATKTYRERLDRIAEREGGLT